ncbi:hypothetical protein [Cohnella sp.]|uniref:hypothetical protein n=1 Tax=Cohnella sp. TaxID=1883426 RepID=UPI0035690ADF
MRKWMIGLLVVGVILITPKVTTLINPEMGCVYLTDENTAANLQDLTSKIGAAVDNRQQELVIRYMKGTTVTSDMRKAFNAQKGLSGFSYSHEDFTRTPDNDKLVRIVFKYQ